MTRRDLLRRTCTAAAAALIALWAASCFTTVFVGNSRGFFGMADGGIGLSNDADALRAFGAHESPSGNFWIAHAQWKPRFEAPEPKFKFTHGSFWIAIIPIWIPAALFAIPAAWLWRAVLFPRHKNCCRGCRYPREGLAVDTVCPECGATPSLLPASSRFTRR